MSVAFWALPAPEKKRLFRGAKLIVGVGACVRNTTGDGPTHEGKRGKAALLHPHRRRHANAAAFIA